MGWLGNQGKHRGKLKRDFKGHILWDTSHDQYLRFPPPNLPPLGGRSFSPLTQRGRVREGE